MEEEWEIVVCVGSKIDYWWGNKFGVGKVNMGWVGIFWFNKSIFLVKVFVFNVLGFYDMVGNVWEWIGDLCGLVKGGVWSFLFEMVKVYSEFFVGLIMVVNYVGF